jgi:hypothetical protein
MYDSVLGRFCKEATALVARQASIGESENWRPSVAPWAGSAGPRPEAGESRPTTRQSKIDSTLARTAGSRFVAFAMIPSTWATALFRRPVFLKVSETEFWDPLDRHFASHNVTSPLVSIEMTSEPLVLTSCPDAPVGMTSRVVTGLLGLVFGLSRRECIARLLR